MADITIELEAEKFGIFMDTLSILGKSCDDVVIKEGKICQKSNHRTIIFEIDLTSVLGNIDLPMSGINIKEKMLQPFRKQQVDINIDIGEGDNSEYRFYDVNTSLNIRKPLISYLTNQYMDGDAFRSAQNINLEDKILTYEFEKYLIDRLNAIAEGLAASLIRINFRGGEATFIIKSSDQNSTTKATLCKVADVAGEIEGYCALPVEPFQLSGSGNFTSEFWFIAERNQILMKLTTYIDPEKEVPMSLWCISQLKSFEELE